MLRPRKNGTAALANHYLSVEYRDLSRWLESTGVEFKSFMLKQDFPVKVVVRGLPSNTEPEDIKTEMEAEGFKISQMKNYRTKAPHAPFLRSDRKRRGCPENMT
ncbi:zinc finger protein [Trichonephila clavipes]|nr:zinc finger protein [Trichonephila clavipes]